MMFSRHTAPIACAALLAFTPAAFRLRVAYAQAAAEQPSAQTGSDAPDDTKTGSDPEQAKALWLQAKQLQTEGRLRAACETFQRSLALNPALATLLNLGYCQRELGNIVTAHDFYRRAEVLATLLGDTKRREAAHDEAAALAPQRATLLLRIAGSDADSGEIEVRIDDVPQPREVWSRPMFIDAGDHLVSIRAPEHQPFRDQVRVQDGVRAELVVPDLQRLPFAPLRAAEAPPAAPSSMVSPEVLALHQSRQRNQAQLGAMRVAAFGVGGAGVVSLGIGLLFGQLAKNADNDSQAYCRMACDEQGRLLRETAFAHATRSTVLSVAGGLGVASGLVLWLLAPAPDVAPAPTIALSLSPHMFGPEIRGVY